MLSYHALFEKALSFASGLNGFGEALRAGTALKFPIRGLTYELLRALQTHFALGPCVRLTGTHQCAHLAQ